MKNKIFLFTIFLLGFTSLSAQTLVGGTICSSGASQINNTASIVSTLGGCDNCGSLTGENGGVGTGFPVDDNDCFSVSFEFNSIVDDCGTTFDFFYTGNAGFDDVMFEWNFGANAFPQISNQANPTNIVYSSLGDKEITLRVTDDGCDIIVIGSINVNAIGLPINPIITKASCFDEINGAIQLEVNGGAQPITYNWSTGETTSSIFNIGAGDYGYTVTDGTGCTISNIATIPQPDEIAVTFNVTDETCKGDLNGAISIMIAGGTPPYSVQWEDDGSTDLVRNQLTTGDFTVKITDENNCQIAASTFVDEACDPRIFNTISPNGDDINDVWMVKGILNFPNNDVQIFNRWGELIYEKNGYSNDWGGTTTGGKNLPAGAYYYVINYNDEENNTLSGSITIIR